MSDEDDDVFISMFISNYYDSQYGRFADMKLFQGFHGRVVHKYHGNQHSMIECILCEVEDMPRGLGGDRPQGRR